MKYRCKICGYECGDTDDMGMHLVHGHKIAVGQGPLALAALLAWEAAIGGGGEKD